MKNYIRKYNLTFKKYVKIEEFLRILDENIKITNKTDKKLLETLNKIIKEKIVLLKNFNVVKGFLYFSMYSTFISAILQISIINEIHNLTTRILSVAGTGLLATIIILINKIEDLIYQDINLISTQMIAIYMNYEKTSKNLYIKENNFEEFLKYFEEKDFVKNDSKIKK